MLGLGLVFGEGELKVSLVYSEKEVVFLTTLLQNEVIVEEQSLENEVEEEVEEIEIVENKTIVVEFSNLSLTNEEREVLEEKFGEIKIETIKQENKSDKLIIGSQIGEYTIEHYYDYPQDKEVLKSQLEVDRIKWLKHIARTLSKEEPPQVDVVEDIYVMNFTE